MDNVGHSSDEDEDDATMNATVPYDSPYGDSQSQSQDTDDSTDTTVSSASSATVSFGNPKKRNRTVAQSKSKSHQMINSGITFPVNCKDSIPENFQKMFGVEPWGKNVKNPLLKAKYFLKIFRYNNMDLTAESTICTGCSQKWEGVQTFTLGQHAKKCGGLEALQKMNKFVEPKQPSLSESWQKKDDLQHQGNRLLVDLIAHSNLTINQVCNPQDTGASDSSQLSEQDKDDIEARNYFDKFAKKISGGRYKIPDEKTLRRLVIERSTSIKSQTKTVLQQLGVCFSPNLITDCWTSNAGRQYYGICVQFVDVNWKLQCIVLDVKRMEDTKDGPALAQAVQDTLADYQIAYKGCLGGTKCRNRDQKHSETSPEKPMYYHVVFSQTTDSGGADPVAGSKCACNPMR